MDQSKAIILIDDDEFFHFTFTKQLKIQKFPHRLIAFMNVQDGLAFFKNEINSYGLTTIVTLVDINMPVYDGWDFLEEIEKGLWAELKMDKKLFMLSSSVDKEDINFSKVFTSVSGYLQKPLDTEKVNKILLDNEML